MGNRVKAVRKAAGLTQKEFAAQMGVTVQCVGRWEDDGQIAPTAERLIQLLFGVSPEWWETGQGEMFLPGGRSGWAGRFADDVDSGGVDPVRAAVVRAAIEMPSDQLNALVAFLKQYF